MKESYIYKKSRDFQEIKKMKHTHIQAYHTQMAENQKQKNT